MKKLIFCTLFFLFVLVFSYGTSYNTKATLCSKLIFDHTTIYSCAQVLCKGYLFEAREMFTEPEVTFDLKNYYLNFENTIKPGKISFSAGTFNFGKTFSRLKNPVPAVCDGLKTAAVNLTGICVNFPGITNARQDYAFYASLGNKIDTAFFCTTQDFSCGNIFIHTGKKICVNKAYIHFSNILGIYHVPENSESSWFTKNAWYQDGYLFSSISEVSVKIKHISFLNTLLVSQNPYKNLIPAFRFDLAYNNKNNFFKTNASVFYCPDNFFSITGKPVTTGFLGFVNPQFTMKISKQKNMSLKIGITTSISQKEKQLYDTHKFAIEFSKPLNTLLLKASLKNVFTEENAQMTSSIKYSFKSAWNVKIPYLMFFKTEYSANPQKQNDVPVIALVYNSDWFSENTLITAKIKTQANFKQLLYSLEISGALNFKNTFGKTYICLDLIFPGNKSINTNSTKINLNFGYAFLINTKTIAMDKKRI